MQKSQSVATLFLRLFLVPLFLLSCRNLQAQSQSTATPEKLGVYPSLIVHNGKIASYGPEIDQNVTFYEAMAVRGDRIWRLGTNQEIRELAGSQTQLIDLKGRTVVPGLIDAHTHPMMWAWNQFGGQILPELEPAYAHGKDLEEIRQNIRRVIQQRIQKAGKDQWVIVSIPHRLSNEVQVRWPQHGHLYPDFVPSGRLTREELQSIAPDTPVVIISGVTGGSANKKARELMSKALGYEPSSGVRIPYDLIWGVILKGKTAQAADMASREMQNMVNYGVTTSASHGEVNTEYYKALYTLDRQGKMPMRFGWSHEHGFFGSKDPVEFYRLLGNIAGQGSDYLWNVGVGWEAWDATSSQCLTARPKNWRPEDTPPTPHSTCLPADSLEYRAHLAAAEAGLRLFMLHNNQDHAMDRLFAIAEQAIKNGSRTLEDIQESQWNMAHSRWIRPEQIPLIKKYNFAIDFQAKNMVPQVYDVRNFYDPKYLSWTLPAKRLLEAGITFNLSTDTPISRLSDEQEDFLNNLPSRLPFRDTMWGVIGVWVQQVTEVAMGEFGSGERRTVPVALGPEQRIDRISALKAATIWGAKNVLREDRLGSLEPGKLADFVVMDKDYFTVPEPEIMKIKTLMTALGGKIVYKAMEF